MFIYLGLALALCFWLPYGVARAQFPLPTGAHHPELEWRELETEHFRLIYHAELDSIMPEGAKLAEEAYRVVTTNLETTLPKKLKMYFSDNDDIRNAYAFSHDHIFIWMRGITDDLPYSIRASGTSKWLRSVITHELTHSVIAYATRDILDVVIPDPGVPRWFNEGMARYMEPDGWTEDLDMVLRVSAVTGELDIGGPGYFQGTLLYEAGHSLVRYIAATYGDSTLVNIIKHPRTFSFRFASAVEKYTKKSLSEIVRDWSKRVNVYYNTRYGQKEETADFGRKIPTGLSIVSSARLSPDGKRIAVLGKRSWESPTLLYILEDDTSGRKRMIEVLTGMTGKLSWSPDGEQLLLSKMRFGHHASLLADLYTIDVETGNLTRITTDGEFDDASYSPDGEHIVAVRNRLSGSDLWLLRKNGSVVRQLTQFNNKDVSVYWPRWSESGGSIAFSIFDAEGRRDVATIDTAVLEIKYLTRDSVNERYPIWIDGDIAHISYVNGVPNLVRRGVSATTRLTDVAGAVTAWDWSREKDSVLVTSVDSRNEVTLYWIPADRDVKSAPDVALKDKYTEWRDVHWPLTTRPSDSLAPVATKATHYNSLLEVRPLLVVPLLSTDKSRTGKHGLRYSITALATDPMQKHFVRAFVDWGDASREASYSLRYHNNHLRPSLMFSGGSTLSFNGVINNISYYEKQQHAGAGFLIAFPAPNALDQSFFIMGGGEYRRQMPWNEVEFASTPQERKPIHADIANLGGQIGFLSPDLLTSYTYFHSDRKLLSDLTFSRHRLGASYRLPLNDERTTFFALYGRALAQFGEELPQEFLGFTPYDIFEGGVSLRAITLQDRLRGIRKYIYGNRLIIGSAEFRMPDNIFQRLFTPLQAFRPQLAYFFDIGTTWYGTAPANNPNVPITAFSKTHWLKTAGVELRSEVAPGTALSAGVGWELVKYSRADWYLRTVIEW